MADLCSRYPPHSGHSLSGRCRSGLADYPRQVAEGQCSRHWPSRDSWCMHRYLGGGVVHLRLTISQHSQPSAKAFQVPIPTRLQSKQMIPCAHHACISCPLTYYRDVLRPILYLPAPRPTYYTLVSLRLLSVWSHVPGSTPQHICTHASIRSTHTCLHVCLHMCEHRNKTWYGIQSTLLARSCPIR